MKTDFLHPTTRGGQIRTLEIIRRLHARHEVHYVAFDEGSSDEGVRRAIEYSAKSYPVRHKVVSKSSPAFLAQLAAGLVSPLPVAVSRWKSAAMEHAITELRRTLRFDAVVCDFLAPAPNIADLQGCVLFQHNVETAIWQRHQEHAPDPLRKAYFALQARRMFDYEKEVCRAVNNIIAVSESDAALMRSMFAVESVAAVPTGVDVKYFQPPARIEPNADLVFVGSMDWMPNIEAMRWFVREILPVVRRSKPGCTLTIVGRKPTPEIVALAAADPRIHVTGTVPDIRPHLWGSSISIVPLRIGGGTRLKIYESMASRVPVVSTSVGAEGLDVRSPDNILLADSAEAFADACVRLLESAAERERIARAAFELVSSRFSWDTVVRSFEDALAVPTRR